MNDLYGEVEDGENIPDVLQTWKQLIEVTPIHDDTGVSLGSVVTIIQKPSSPNIKGLERDLYLRKKHNISLEEFRDLERAQGGNCKCCGNPPTEGKNLAIDKFYGTKKIRGLICSKCRFLLFKVPKLEKLELIMKYLKGEVN